MLLKSFLTTLLQVFWWTPALIKSSLSVRNHKLGVKMEWIRMVMLNETISSLHKFSTLSSFFFFFLKTECPRSQFSWENYSILRNWLSKPTYCLLRIRCANNLLQYNSELPESLETMWYGHEPTMQSSVQLQSRLRCLFLLLTC